MDQLAYKKLKHQILSAQAAKAELEFKIEERLEDIKRLQDHIKLQEKRESDLNDELAKLDKGAN